jgi:CheY-like chemotaxis protein
MRNSRPILLAEDDDVDTMTVKRALMDIEITSELVHVTSGEEALQYLRDERNKKPFLILLDLNMPKMNGIEFLKVVKGNDALKSIPVVVLTTSKEEHDVAETFAHGIAGYIVKPIDYRQFVEAIKAIWTYWTLSELPQEEMGDEYAKLETNTTCRI